MSGSCECVNGAFGRSKEKVKRAKGDEGEWVNGEFGKTK